MIQSLIDLGPYQWVGLLFGIAYVIFAAKNRPICWIFGIISCSSIAIEDFTSTHLYADGILQIIYVLMGIWGLVTWKLADQVDAMDITTLSRRNHFVLITIGLVFTMILFSYFRTTEAAFPFLDSLTTSFSIMATFMLVQKKVENWIYWVWIDSIYIYLYFDRDAPLFSLLMLIYLIVAVWGYFTWRKHIFMDINQ